MRNFSRIENTGFRRPGSLAEDLGGGEEEDSRWEKTSKMGTVQARDSLPTTGYGDFRLNFSNIFKSYPGS
jgi:hypothetical protein